MKSNFTEKINMYIHCSFKNIIVCKWNNRYPKPIEDIFANAITTNGQELESMDLQIIFNFDLFYKEGLKFLVEDEGGLIILFLFSWNFKTIDFTNFLKINTFHSQN